MGLILLIIAVVASCILFPISLMYTLFRSIVIGLLRPLRLKPIKYILDLCKSIAIGIDQLGNVVCQDVFNDTLIKKTGHKFGNPDETVSRVLGINKKTNTLSKFGKWWADFLNWVDPNHVENASK